MAPTQSIVPVKPIKTEISRNDFPEGFVWGCGTSAYQVCNILDGTNGNIAVDMYSRYKEDIRMMKSMGFEAYRFSISWSRILPGGKLSLGINQEGIDYYNDLINTLIANDIKPYVTLFHWDLPYLLEKEYGGFLSEKIVYDFRDFAELCFWEFGDRVQHWITLNEAWTYSCQGYVNRIFPPGNGYGFGGDQMNPRDNSVIDQRKELEIGQLEKGIDELGKMAENEDLGVSFVPYRGVRVESQETFVFNNKTIVLRKLMSPPRDKAADKERAKEAYTVARNLLLSHAAAVQSYRKKFQEHQKGKIGITLVTHWFEPLNDTEKDRKAAKRALDFMLGWFLEPVLRGRYPQNMMDYAGHHIKPFSPEESNLLRGSLDFLGLNYYTAWYATHDDNPDAAEGYYRDQKTGSSWLYIVPWGIYKLLKSINDAFNNDTDKLPAIYITENGCDEQNNHKLTPNTASQDTQRQNYFRDHLAKILEAMNKDHVKIEAYFAWSWCDNFEWYDGYRSRFGIVYVDYKNDLQRHAKDSAKWFAKFLQK
ncbi:hypothetical protein DH2020_001870 [Rehmannia glutinosa]|uniref:Beta-glucosidase n=1 Tax=Rehmannia glutinosa TaxID=99300 RepID=A0ABR0XST5_REHGL